MGKLTFLLKTGDFVVVDKPAGILVHPAYKPSNEPTIESIVSGQLSQPVYLVHRLDRDTSGVLLIATNDPAKRQLQKQFQNRTVSKTYLALVSGIPKHRHAIIDMPIARHSKNPMKRAVSGIGKLSQTEYKVIATYPSAQNLDRSYSLLEVQPKTGRTHQIRVHLAHLGYPIVGDKLYGKPDPILKRPFLHAARLSFHDLSGKPVSVESKIPAELNSYLNHL